MICIAIALIVVFAFVAVLVCCKVSEDCTREEEEHPCASCLRWSECNGVDDDCPIRR